MTALPASPTKTAEKFLVLLNGPEAGVAYKLLGSKLTIGRSRENDVILQDTKASRRHVSIEVGADGKFLIKDLGSQNGIMVNGQVCREATLKDGDVFLIGETQIKFGPQAAAPAAKSLSVQAPTATSVPAVTNKTPPTVKPQTQTGISTSSYTLPPLAQSKDYWVQQIKEKPKYYLWGAALVLGLVLTIVFSQGQKAKKLAQFRDESAQLTQVENLEKQSEALSKEIEVSGKNTPQYEESQAFYLRGFRDYREGNYLRAIQNFETALTLYPKHPLASRYLGRSRQKLEESISKALERAEKAYDLKKFNVAMNEYRTVILLSGDPKKPSYQLAKKRIDLIEKEIQRNR